MPKKAHDALEKEGRKKGFTGKRLARYIYGGLRNIGWKPRRERKLAKPGR